MMHTSIQMMLVIIIIALYTVNDHHDASNIKYDASNMDNDFGDKPMGQSILEIEFCNNMKVKVNLQ